PPLIEFSFQDQVGCQAASAPLLPLRSAFDLDLLLISGTPKPKRGAEWWGKSPSVTLGLFQSDPP
ncbi:hypothetical protein, partial [Pseudomonas putida]